MRVLMVLTGRAEASAVVFNVVETAPILTHNLKI